MSIHQLIVQWELEKRLISVPCEGFRKREIFLNQTVFEQLGRHEISGEVLELVRIARLLRDFQDFALGNLIEVSGGKQVKGQMKQLDPSSREIWEYRSREPSPSIRAFGRFALCDCYIVTNLASREYLGDPNDPKNKAWRNEILRCETEWKSLFFELQPVSGENVNEYISANVNDIRKPRS